VISKLNTRLHISENGILVTHPHENNIHPWTFLVSYRICLCFKLRVACDLLMHQ